ncbi:MAG: hypothetical protein IAG10_17075 [Planctomycetaceae bacterium]|nr:hypothetical protein [Planctomycetaceae bacterium]
MNFRPTAFVVVTSGLIVAAGIISGCQVPRAVRSWETPSFPWRRNHEPRPSVSEDRFGSETYVPEGFETPLRTPQQPVPEQRNLRLPPDPSFTPEPVPNDRPAPVPPALEIEAPQARRWMPSRPSNRMASAPQTTRESESTSDAFNLPPARVTYESEATTDEPIITPAPEPQSSSQPRLFRPAGTAKNMYESVKRKFSR